MFHRYISHGEFNRSCYLRNVGKPIRALVLYLLKQRHFADPSFDQSRTLPKVYAYYRAVHGGTNLRYTALFLHYSFRFRAHPLRNTMETAYAFNTRGETGTFKLSRKGMRTK